MPAPSQAMKRTARRIPLSAIDAAVAARLGPGRVCGNAQPAVFSRQVAMYLAKHVGGWSTTQIGRFYNGRDHSTVCYALKRVASLREDDPEVDGLVASLAGEIQTAEPKEHGHTRAAIRTNQAPAGGPWPAALSLAMHRGRPAAAPRHTSPGGAPGCRFPGVPSRSRLVCRGLRRGDPGSSRGSSVAAASSTCAVSQPSPTRTSSAPFALCWAPGAEACTSSPRPGTWTTESRRWCAPSPGSSRTGGTRSSRRGLTIDLGYAWTTLASGEEVAFVDVPGHQRFIGNMLAGWACAGGALRRRRRRGVAPAVRLSTWPPWTRWACATGCSS